MEIKTTEQIMQKKVAINEYVSEPLKKQWVSIESLKEYINDTFEGNDGYYLLKSRLLNQLEEK